MDILPFLQDTVNVEVEPPEVSLLGLKFKGKSISNNRENLACAS